MIKLNINLLPPGKKERLKFLIKFIFSKEILELIIFTCSIIAIALVWSWLILQQSVIDITSASALVNKDYQVYNKDIRDINTLVKNINKASLEYQTISPRLIELINNLPANIKITSLSLDRQTQTLDLQGVAATREDLLNYQTTLKKIGWLEEVNTPVSKLFQKTDITFEFKTKIKDFVPIK